MIKDTQEYLQHWEKENNPFYPSEMRWDRLQVNRFLKDYKKQLTLTNVSQQRELLIAELKEWDLGYTSFNNLEEKLAEKLLKAINCG